MRIEDNKIQLLSDEIIVPNVPVPKIISSDMEYADTSLKGVGVFGGTRRIMVENHRLCYGRLTTYTFGARFSLDSYPNNNRAYVFSTNVEDHTTLYFTIEILSNGNLAVVTSRNRIETSYHVPLNQTITVIAIVSDRLRVYVGGVLIHTATVNIGGCQVGKYINVSGRYGTQLYRLPGIIEEVWLFDYPIGYWEMMYLSHTPFIHLQLDDFEDSTKRFTPTRFGQHDIVSGGPVRERYLKLVANRNNGLSYGQYAAYPAPIEFSVSCRVYKSEHNPDTYPIFWSFGLPYLAVNGPNHPFRLSYRRFNGTQGHCEGGPVVELNRWYHVVCIGSKDGTELWVDGELVASKQTPIFVGSMPAWHNSTIRVGEHGTHQSGNIRYSVSGGISDLVIFNKKIPPEYIKHLHKSMGNITKDGVIYLPDKSGNKNPIVSTLVTNEVDERLFAYCPMSSDRYPEVAGIDDSPSPENPTVTLEVGRDNSLSGMDTQDGLSCYLVEKYDRLHIGTNNTFTSGANLEFTLALAFKNRDSDWVINLLGQEIGNNVMISLSFTGSGHPQIHTYGYNGNSDLSLCRNTNVVVKDNEWHYMAMTYKLGKLSLYVDGLVTTANFSITHPTFRSKFTVGKSFHSGFSDRNFDGWVSEISILKRCVELDELIEMHRKFKARLERSVYMDIGKPIANRVVLGLT